MTNKCTNKAGIQNNPISARALKHNQHFDNDFSLESIHHITNCGSPQLFNVLIIT